MKMENKTKSRDIGEEIVVISIGIGSCICLCTICWELYVWLKVGQWPDNTLGDWLKWFGVNLMSIYYPINWIGVAKIIQWFLKWPISIFLPVMIICSAFVTKWIINYED
jgi:hypothetical protein